MGTNSGLISGRVKKVPATNADPNRYNWLNLQNAEPDLGVPTSNGSFFTSDSNGTRSWSNTIVVSNSLATIKSLKVDQTSNLGTVSNIAILGGSVGQVLTTDGSGNLSWTTPTANGGGGGANITVDNFTGNGVQTTFLLSVTPAGIDQTFVNYNGVTLLRDAYSLSGANIIFDSAPANASQIEVSIFSTANVQPQSELANGTSNITIPIQDGPIYMTVNGNANILTVTGNGIIVSGISNLGSNGNVLITGGSNGQALVTDGNGNLSWSTIISSVSNVSNGNSNINIATAGGDITFSANGNANVMTISGSKINLGNSSNLTISGGSNGQALITDGNGNVTWGNVAGSPGGFNTYVQFNDSGNFAGSGKFLWNKVSNTLTVSNVTVLGNNNQLTFQNGSGNAINFLVPSTANNASFIVPNATGTTQQVLGIVADGGAQTLGWKTVPTNYITVGLRDSTTYTSSPVPVLRVYPLRLRNGTFLDLTVTQ
jgi:hypothetical protein